MAQYTASIPADNSVPKEVQKFFESFYRISDTENGHEEYAQQFTSDGVLIMIADEVRGREAIVAKRNAMWEKVASRSHHPTKIFAFGPGGTEFMLHGTVDYSLKDGRKASGIDWAARAQFSNVADGLKMRFYQVYLDSASMAAKAK